MATFGITPVTGYPLPPSDSFPNFIQFQNSGKDLGGSDADTVNFASGISATRGTGENSGVVTVTDAVVWRDTDVDTTLALADAGNGIAMTAGGTLTVPPHSSVAFLDGTSILLLDEAAAVPFTVVAGAGVTINVRSAFQAASAGQFALVTLVQRGLDNWILAGDLGLA